MQPKSIQLVLLSNILLLLGCEAFIVTPTISRLLANTDVSVPSELVRSKRSDSTSRPEVVIVDASKGDPAYHFYSEHDHSGHGDHSEEHKPPTRYQVAKFDFDHVSTPYIISLWIIIVGLAKIGFHVIPKLSSVCPESVVLMILGVFIGLIMWFAGIPEDRLKPLTPNLFFLYMLPPIVMDAGYHMPNRLFFDNLFTILLYAVIGTIWNALAIGLSLYGCSLLGAFGEHIPFLDIMLFSSTVSAVDPVAVLAVFEEIHVNEVLYILVFGESLLNDAVTVVLYHMFEGYAEMAYHYGIASIQPIDYISGVASFFVVALGGTLMGVIWGFLAAFVSRFTHHVKIIEPIFVFVMAYLSYLSAEMFHLSGIMSLTFCGITMKNYVEENITQKSHTTLKYAMKMLANSSEAIIFVFLGVCTVTDQHRWNTPFVTLTIIFCLVYRTIGLTAITNRFRLNRVNRVEQFIMSYGGLRGAVAFALILIINKQIIHAREMMVTTIIAVVYFTVFLQGMTVGALVNILNVPRANKFRLSMNERIHTRLMDHVMAGLEDISGMMVGNYKMRDKFRYYNNRYLRHWLVRDSKEMGHASRKIFETASRLDLQDAMNLVSKQNSSNQLQVNRFIYNYNNSNGKNNNNNTVNDNNGGGGQGGQPIPNIFLSGPQTQPNGAILDPSQSLTALFRTYTQSNLTALDSNETNNSNESTKTFPTTNNTPLEKDFNYDIGNIAYSPSLKDLKDAELHHILDDNMFKPFKKINHYRRDDYQDEEPLHPPFQHQVRMQIRRLISQSEQKRRSRQANYSLKDSGRKHRHKKKKHSYSLNYGDKERTRQLADDGEDEIELQNTDLSDAAYFNPLTKDSDEKQSNKQTEEIVPNEEEEDDDGIVFTAHHDDVQVDHRKCTDNTGEPEKSSVSWVKRSPSTDSIPGNKDGLVRQREFPPWIENREYVQDYASPTVTLLDRINPLETKKKSPPPPPPPPRRDDQSKPPSVYDIFDISKQQTQPTDEHTVIQFEPNKDDTDDSVTKL